MGVKNTLQPKKPLAAWLLFNAKKLPELKEAGLPPKDAMRESAETWRAMSEAEKAPFEEAAKADKKRYDREKDELEQKGFFTLADGSRSTDHYVDPRKKYGEDALLPKRPPSAFGIFFASAEMRDTMGAMPEGVGVNSKPVRVG